MTLLVALVCILLAGVVLGMLAERLTGLRRRADVRVHGPFPHPGYGVPDDVPILPGQRWDLFGVGEVMVRWHVQRGPIGVVGYRLVDNDDLISTQDVPVRDFRRVARPLHLVDGRTRVVVDVPSQKVGG